MRSVRNIGLVLLLLFIPRTAKAEASASTSTISMSTTTTITIDSQFPEEKVLIEGNVVITDQVYRALITPLDDGVIDARDEARTQQRLIRFLKKAGYELARVEVHRDKGTLIIKVDEGRLERIIFPGQRGLGALRLQLMLDLPGNVFNRPFLEEQIHRFQAEHGIQVLAYKIVTVHPSEHDGVQFTQVGEIRGFALAPEEGRHELHLFVAETDLPSGLHLDVDARSGDGLRARVKYRTDPLLLDDDRWEVAGEVGMRLQKIISSSEGSKFFSRAGGGLSWYSPLLLELPLRLVVSTDGLFISRQRLDLGIRSYVNFESESVVKASFRVEKTLQIGIGGGAEYRRLVDLDRTPEMGDIELVRPFESMIPLAVVSAELELGGDGVRLDRLHKIELELRQTFRRHGWRTLADVSWRKTFGLGFDDFAVGVEGTAVLGRVAFVDEKRVADHLRGLFGDRIYCSRVASASLEYRVSLVRDLYKISLFHDGATCAEGAIKEFLFADAFGVGFHALLFDTFRLSVYIAQGFATNGMADTGLSLSLTQAF